MWHSSKNMALSTSRILYLPMLLRNVLRAPSHAFSTNAAIHSVSTKLVPSSPPDVAAKETYGLDISSQVGSVVPLSMLRMGTLIHNIELRPGQGPKLVRAAGTVAKITSMSARHCEVKLPSGQKKVINIRCEATVGRVRESENANKKLYKAGQNRWLGIRPKVRGVAMNPVDHPHGGGEGKSKSGGSHGRGSRTPWGKPTKCGYKTRSPKKKNII